MSSFNAPGPAVSNPLEYFNALDGLQLPGGCGDCDAYQTLDATTPPLYVVTVHHDDDCPTLARHTRRSAS